jgi:peptidoglycan/LPS O-acetylase OafA/YrhL
MQRPTLTNIQVLRFIAAVAVLTKHAIFVFFPDTWLLALPWSGGVDLFFVISGFIMAWLTRGSFGHRGASGRFLLRRAIRIVPPYWFFTSFMVVILLIAPDAVRHTRLTLDSVISSYAFSRGRAPATGACGRCWR